MGKKISELYRLTDFLDFIKHGPSAELLNLEQFLGLFDFKESGWFVSCDTWSLLVRSLSAQSVSFCRAAVDVSVGAHAELAATSDMSLAVI